MKAGKVILVGAGPGDPGLITRKGWESLAAAEVIVYDHLLDESLLDCASASAEKIYAGKSASQHALEQSEINALLVAKAQEGKLVVRLKGGDPFIFGRGGEECEALADKNIPFEIVPGISSSVAVPAYAGIPLTHRQVASSFTVVTGHENPAKNVSSLRWDKLATGADTLVFLMGMANLSLIVAKLMENGRAGDTPVAVIKDGTRPEQKTVTGTLQTIVAKVAAERLGHPAIILVGEVVNLREKLRWFDNRPLSGKRILVTRSRRQASALSQLLAASGAQPLELPAIDIRPLPQTAQIDSAISDLSVFQWILFTSVNGVAAFFDRLRALRLDSRNLKGISLGAIGPATVRALESHGLAPDYCPAVFTTRDLLAGLSQLPVAGKHFLLPRADIADQELSRGLEKLGAIVRDVPVYCTLPASDDLEKAAEALRCGMIDVITFTSSSTVTNLVKTLGAAGPQLNNVKIAAIGPKTAETARLAGLKVDILASEQTIPGLVEAIIEYYQRSPR